jgi:hypothetical protein
MSGENEIDIGQIPPSILISMRSSPFGWSMVLGELVDNSFDASATRIDIEFASKSMTVSDDGSGCDNVEKMLTIGAHYKQSSTKLGRYGVGLKDAACWLWGRLQIRTTRNGSLRRADVDWDALSKSKSWKISTPDPAQATGHGTQLVFSDISRKMPDFESLAESLGYMFAPAILWGRQIRIFRPRKAPICVRAWQMPDLSQQVNERFEVNGKRVHLIAGIVPQDCVNEKSGFNVCHEHRMICNTSFGSGGYSTSRICGTMTLDESWMLSKNKTELVDDDSDELAAAIFYHCEGILKASSEQAKFLRNTALESSVTEKLRLMLGGCGVKEKRDSPSNNSGTVKSKNRRKRNPTGKTQPGDRIASRLAGRVRMEWRSRADGLMGEVDIPGAVIYLNSSHERLAHHQKSGNDDALADACMTLITFEEMEKEERSKLFADYSGFVEALSSVLKSQQSSSVDTPSTQSAGEVTT